LLAVAAHRLAHRLRRLQSNAASALRAVSPTEVTMRKCSAQIFAIVLFTSWIAAAVPGFANDPDHPDNQPLKVPLDVGLPPFAFKTPDGKTTGFAYDLAVEIARRLGRPGVAVQDVNFSAVFAGLYAKRFEMVTAPTNITKERAEKLLFSEPYMPTGLGFLVKKGSGKITSLDALKGKTVAVNSGSLSDTWASANAGKYGFTVQRYNKNADAVEAVMVGRAFANIADLPVTRYIAMQNPMVEIGYVYNSGNNFGLVFRPDDKAFRYHVDSILKCMKTDGSFAKIYKKWFGIDPEPDTSAATVYPGTGAPGFPGYDPTAPKAPCR
jgi:polar amino acid transport system substrate-binding protein